MMKVINIIVLLTTALLSFISHAALKDATIVGKFGSHQALAIDGENNIYCTMCGFGEKWVKLSGTGSSEFSDIVLYYHGVALLHENMGVSCPLGRWFAVDMNNRKVNTLDIDTCDERDVTFSITEKSINVIFGKDKDNKIITVPLS